MAAIIKRHGGYQAQTCVRGKRRAKTFRTRAEARRWASEIEAMAEAEMPAESRKTLREVTGEAFARNPHRSRLMAISVVEASGLADQQICNLSKKDITEYRDRIAERIAPGSANRFLVCIRSALAYAVKKGWLHENPAQDTSLKVRPELRERVPSEDEYRRLESAAGWHEGEVPQSAQALVIAAFRFAMLTGMRGGEILAIERAWIDDRVIHLPAEATKSRRARDVALGDGAMRILESVLKLGFAPRIWGISAPQKSSWFVRMREIARLGELRDSEGRVIRQALHFHDSRAAFVTWCAQNGISIAECCRQVGHTSTAMLMRYYRGTADELAEKLR